MSNIPARLRINGRPIDGDFSDPDEELYRRFRLAEFPCETEDLHLLIRIPRLCVFRQKYCESPTDVLYSGSFEEGVLAWTVDNIRSVSSRITKNLIAWELNVVHVPENDLYPHSEIQTIKRGEATPPKKVGSSALKSLIRFELQRFCA